jgi:hypothetical protein
MSDKIMISCRLERKLRDKIYSISNKIDKNFSETFRIILTMNSSELNQRILQDKNGK